MLILDEFNIMCYVSMYAVLLDILNVANYSSNLLVRYIHFDCKILTITQRSIV